MSYLGFKDVKAHRRAVLLAGLYCIGGVAVLILLVFWGCSR